MNLMDRLSHFILYGVGADMSDKELLERSITQWLTSPERSLQIKAFLYYDNEHDILKRKRTMIGEDGKLTEVENLPNNHIINNLYAKMVNQKTNYLLGQPFVTECDNEKYLDELKSVFNKRFMRIIKTVGKYSINGGLAWLYPYYGTDGTLKFRVFPSYEILPFWKDSEHTELSGAIRLYLVKGYNESKTPTIIQKVEVYTLDGIHRYVLDGNHLIDDLTSDEIESPYIRRNDGSGSIQPFNWTRIPLIPFKRNETETPLLKHVKSLQDGINIMLSDFENNMQEDSRNTILILKNYDGTNLGEFRKNLATFGAVKVRDEGDAHGGVETLEVTVNSDNYKSIIEIFKKALIENAMGYDAKDDRLGSNANQLNIKSMYSDIDIDANDMETEFQAAFEDLLFFINAYISNKGGGNYEGEDVNIIFNRDILISESEVIENCAKSVGILSDETIISQHPWVDDVELELKRLEEQKKKNMEEYAPFNTEGGDGDDPESNPSD